MDNIKKSIASNRPKKTGLNRQKLLKRYEARKAAALRFKKDQEYVFSQLERQLGHKVVNIYPPTNKDEIKKLRKEASLSCENAAVICGVTRKTWTVWENYSLGFDHDTGMSETGKTEPYPSDWQWGWFLLAINRHPHLRLTLRDTDNDPVPKVTGIHYQSQLSDNGV